MNAGNESMTEPLISASESLEDDDTQPMQTGQHVTNNAEGQEVVYEKMSKVASPSIKANETFLIEGGQEELPRVIAPADDQVSESSPKSMQSLPLSTDSTGLPSVSTEASELYEPVAVRVQVLEEAIRAQSPVYESTTVPMDMSPAVLEGSSSARKGSKSSSVVSSPVTRSPGSATSSPKKNGSSSPKKNRSSSPLGQRSSGSFMPRFFFLGKKADAKSDPRLSEYQNDSRKKSLKGLASPMYVNSPIFSPKRHSEGSVAGSTKCSLDDIKQKVWEEADAVELEQDFNESRRKSSSTLFGKKDGRRFVLARGPMEMMRRGSQQLKEMYVYDKQNNPNHRLKVIGLGIILLTLVVALVLALSFGYARKNQGVSRPDSANTNSTSSSDAILAHSHPVNPLDTQDINSPDSQDINSPDSQDINSPDSQDINSPDSQDMNPLDSQDINSPDNQDMNSPDSQDMNSPDSQDMNSPDSQDMNPPDTEDMNAPDSQDMNPPDSQDMNPSDSQDMNSPEAQDMNPLDTQDMNSPDSQDMNPSDSQDMNPSDSQDMNSPDTRNMISLDSQDIKPSDSQNMNPSDSQDMHSFASQEVDPHSRNKSFADYNITVQQMNLAIPKSVRLGQPLKIGCYLQSLSSSPTNGDSEADKAHHNKEGAKGLYLQLSLSNSTSNQDVVAESSPRPELVLVHRPGVSVSGTDLFDPTGRLNLEVQFSRSSCLEEGDYACMFSVYGVYTVRTPASRLQVKGCDKREQVLREMKSELKMIPNLISGSNRGGKGWVECSLPEKFRPYLLWVDRIVIQRVKPSPLTVASMQAGQNPQLQAANFYRAALEGSTSLRGSGPHLRVRWHHLAAEHAGSFQCQIMGHTSVVHVATVFSPLVDLKDV